MCEAILTPAATENSDWWHMGIKGAPSHGGSGLHFYGSVLVNCVNQNYHKPTVLYLAIHINLSTTFVTESFTLIAGAFSSPF